jgi:hypothetical protein
LVVLFFVGLFALGFFFESIGCNSRWSKSGFDSSYGPIQGCLVKMKDGRWIPEGRYREFE